VGAVMGMRALVGRGGSETGWVQYESTCGEGVRQGWGHSRGGSEREMKDSEVAGRREGRGMTRM
jgi:hypothetical protein